MLKACRNVCNYNNFIGSGFMEEAIVYGTDEWKKIKYSQNYLRAQEARVFASPCFGCRLRFNPSNIEMFFSILRWSLAYLQIR